MRTILVVNLVVVLSFAVIRSVGAQTAATIDTISPAAARAGDLVTIRGIGFGAINVQVTVQGVAAALVSASGNSVTFFLPGGLTPGSTYVNVVNPGGQTSRIAFQVLGGVLLPGDANAPALRAITNQAPRGIDDSDVQNGVILTRLEIFFSAAASIGDVNAVLIRINGGIDSMLAGSAALSVAVPRQNDLAGLQALAQTASAMRGVELATPARAKQPQAFFLSTDVASARHLLPGRVPASWNANALLKGCGARRVPVLVPDYYGPPPAGFFELFPALGDLTGGTQTSINHGYRMIAAMATPGVSPTAGTNPFLDCLDLRPIQIANLGGVAFQDKLVLNLPATGKFIVSMSLGDQGTCEDNKGSNVACTPALTAQINKPLERANAALRWKFLTQPLWSDFLIVAAAGNDRNQGVAGPSIYPGVALAANENEPAVASQPDPFFSFAADATQWTPSPFFLEQGFKPLGATDAEMAVLHQDVVSSGLDVVVEDNALIVGATTNLNPGDASPGYNLLSEAAFSNSFPDVKTVGVDVSDVCTSVPCHSSTGTSIATPQVAGVASYLWLLSPALRALPASVTRQAIVQNTIAAPNVSGILDAYAAALSLDAAGLPTPQSAPVRLALLDVNDDGVFDEQDLAAFVQHYVVTNPDGSVTAVEPTAADFSRYDLNGDGFTGGLNKLERFDLDRVGSTQFGRTLYSTVSKVIENQHVSYDEHGVTDLEILCYYAYSDMYGGDPGARTSLLAGRCGLVVQPASVTLNAGQRQQFTAITPTDDTFTWSVTPGCGSIDVNTGLFTAGSTAGTCTVTATDTNDPDHTGEARVTVQHSGGGRAVGRTVFMSMSAFDSAGNQVIAPQTVSCGTEGSLTGSCSRTIQATGSAGEDHRVSAAVSFSEAGLSATGGSFVASIGCSEVNPIPTNRTFVNLLNSATVDIVVDPGSSATIAISGSISGPAVFRGPSASVQVSPSSLFFRKTAVDTGGPFNGAVAVGPGFYTLHFDANSNGSCSTTTVTVIFSI